MRSAGDWPTVGCELFGNLAETAFGVGLPDEAHRRRRAVDPDRGGGFLGEFQSLYLVLLRGGFIVSAGGALFWLTRIADCAIFRIVGGGRRPRIAISFDEIPVVVIVGFQLASGSRVAGCDRRFRSNAGCRFVNVLLVRQHGWRLFLSFRGNCRGSVEAFFNRPGFDLLRILALLIIGRGLPVVFAMRFRCRVLHCGGVGRHGRMLGLRLVGDDQQINRRLVGESREAGRQLGGLGWDHALDEPLTRGLGDEFPERVGADPEPSKPVEAAATLASASTIAACWPAWPSPPIAACAASIGPRQPAAVLGAASRIASSPPGSTISLARKETARLVSPLARRTVIARSLPMRG